eukprot:scaffold4095_cov117-Cylindrotheca_fusiformis.AAC.23
MKVVLETVSSHTTKIRKVCRILSFDWSGRHSVVYSKYIGPTRYHQRSPIPLRVLLEDITISNAT